MNVSFGTKKRLFTLLYVETFSNNKLLKCHCSYYRKQCKLQLWLCTLYIKMFDQTYNQIGFSYETPRLRLVELCKIILHNHVKFHALCWAKRVLFSGCPHVCLCKHWETTDQSALTFSAMHEQEGTIQLIAAAKCQFLDILLRPRNWCNLVGMHYREP